MDGSLASPPPAAASPRDRLISVEEFVRMIDAGILADEHVELDRGRLVEMAHDGARHVSVASRLIMLWVPILANDPNLRERLRLYSRGTVRLTPAGSVRSPDALLCQPGIFERERRLPEANECILVIEFADSTLAYDEGRKRPDYAISGLPELWIVRLEHEDVRVCRGPCADGSWASETLVSGADMIAPAAAPELAIAAAALFLD